MSEWVGCLKKELLKAECKRTVSLQLASIAELNHYVQLTSIAYHRLRFYATIGGFSSNENCVSAAVNHRYYIWKCTDEASRPFASNGFQLSLACSLCIF